MKCIPEIQSVAWLREVGEIAGWRDQIVTRPRERFPSSLCTDQNVDTVSRRIRRELRHPDPVPTDKALVRTIEWERAYPTRHSA